MATRKSSARRSQGTGTAAARVVDIDTYLSRLSGGQLAALEHLRQTIRRVLPRAQECISYGLPAFRVDGEVVAGFAVTSKGCSYYPFSSITLTTLAEELAAYETTKGALHFDANEPLPVALVRKLIRSRIAERRAK